MEILLADQPKPGPKTSRLRLSKIEPLTLKNLKRHTNAGFTVDRVDVPSGPGAWVRDVNGAGIISVSLRCDNAARLQAVS